jgi:hypothetical protein
MTLTDITVPHVEAGETINFSDTGKVAGFV